MPATALEKNAVLGGQYVLQYAIGEEPARVYAAEKRSSGERVVVRVLRDMTPEQCQGALERARRAMKVRHPMLASVHACGQDDGTVYMVSEFVDGTPLRTWADAIGIPPLATVVDFVHRLSLGLQVAARANLGHGGIAPHNVMVLPFTFGSEARVAGKLLDLDMPEFARSAPRLSAAHFMAPERLVEAHGNWSTVEASPARADVYSVGAILYFLCTGGVPYPARSIRELVEARCDGRPLRPARINPQIPPPLNALMLRALSVAPADRFPSVGELAEALAFAVPSVQTLRTRRGSRAPARSNRETVDIVDEERPTSSSQVTLDHPDDRPTGEVAIPGDQGQSTPAPPTMPPPPSVASHAASGQWELPTVPPPPPAAARSSRPPRGSFSSHPTPAPSPRDAVLPSQVPALRSSSSGVSPRAVPPPVVPPEAWERAIRSSAPPPVPPRSAPPTPTERIALSVALAEEDDADTQPTATGMQVAVVQYASFDELSASRSPLLERMSVRHVAASLAFSVLVAGVVAWWTSSPHDPGTLVLEGAALGEAAGRGIPLAPGEPAAALGTREGSGEAAQPAALTTGAQAVVRQATPEVANEPERAEQQDEPSTSERGTASPARRARARRASRSRRTSSGGTSITSAKPAIDSESADSATAGAHHELADEGGADEESPSALEKPEARFLNSPFGAPSVDDLERGGQPTARAVEPAAPPPKAAPEPPPEPKEPSAPLRARASLAEVTVQGSLPTSVVRRALQRGLDDFARCYRSAAARAGRNGFGVVSVSAEIDLRGRLGRVTTGPGKLPGLSACVGKAANSLATNRRPDTGRVRMKFKVDFAP